MERCSEYWSVCWECVCSVYTSNGPNWLEDRCSCNFDCVLLTNTNPNPHRTNHTDCTKLCHLAVLFKVYKDRRDDCYNAFQWRPLNYTLACFKCLIDIATVSDDTAGTLQAQSCRSLHWSLETTVSPVPSTVLVLLKTSFWASADLRCHMLATDETSKLLSARYTGTSPLEHLYMVVDNLDLICWRYN